MDLHGAPGAQTPKNAFTGQMASEAGFYVDYQYERALKFLEWMTGLIHTVNEFRNVGMLEVVNEPVQDNDKATSMRQNYYPKAFEVSLQTNSASSGSANLRSSEFAPTRPAPVSTKTTTSTFR
jgi:GH35 family endo-1,4-beta-xylanase